MIVVGYIFLRRYDADFRYFILTSAAVSCFMHFWYYYAFPLGFTNLPLHLCHAAITLMLLSFVLKTEPFSLSIIWST